MGSVKSDCCRYDNLSRIVCYSLFFPVGHGGSDLLRQLETSVASLRSYNSDIPVIVFSYLPPAHHSAVLNKIAYRYGLMIRDQGSYDVWLSTFLPKGWRILRHYPVLHKFMNFAAIGSIGAGRALLLDCDTIFASNVDFLFDRYHAADIYAREEPTCKRSHYGYDAEYLDEDMLAAISRSEGIGMPPPFNLGVMLFNNRRWHELHARLPDFLTYVWRFVLWMAGNPPAAAEQAFGEGPGVDLLRSEWAQIVTESEARSALRFPSSNRWISEQVAAWLAVGGLSNGTYSDFARSDVIQNGEFIEQSRQRPNWIVCHYFSQNAGRIAAWMHSVTPNAVPEN